MMMGDDDIWLSFAVVPHIPIDVDAQRAMLDELMGLNRNEDNPDAVVEDYKDEVSNLSFTQTASHQNPLTPSPIHSAYVAISW